MHRSTYFFLVAILTLTTTVLFAQKRGLQRVSGFPHGARHVALLDSASDKDGNRFYLAEFRKNSLKENLGIERREGEVNKYIVKYDALDSLQFARTVGGSHFELFEKLGIDHRGRIFVSGFISSDQVTLPLGYSPSSQRNFFVAVFDSLGSADWATFVPGNWMSVLYDFRFEEGAEYVYSINTSYVPIIRNKYIYLRRPQ